MCTFFTCSSCTWEFFNFCTDAPRDKDNAANETQHCSLELCTRHPNAYQKCLSCEAVLGAVEQLQHLVYQYPWLQTDGLSKLDSMAEWEKEAGFEGLTRKTKKWDEQDESREEEQKVEVRVKEMGLDDLKDERKEHQGFGSGSRSLTLIGTDADQYMCERKEERR